jgi:hypothetical protein
LSRSRRTSVRTFDTRHCVTKRDALQHSTRESDEVNSKAVINSLISQVQNITESPNSVNSGSRQKRTKKKRFAAKFGEPTEKNLNKRSGDKGSKITLLRPSFSQSFFLTAGSKSYSSSIPCRRSELLGLWSISSRAFISSPPVECFFKTLRYPNFNDGLPRDTQASCFFIQ